MTSSNVCQQLAPKLLREWHLTHNFCLWAPTKFYPMDKAVSPVFLTFHHQLPLPTLFIFIYVKPGRTKCNAKVRLLALTGFAVHTSRLLFGQDFWVSGQKPLGQNPLGQNPLGQKPTRT